MDRDRGNYLLVAVMVWYSMLWYGTDNRSCMIGVGMRDEAPEIWYIHLLLSSFRELLISTLILVMRKKKH